MSYRSGSSSTSDMSGYAQHMSDELTSRNGNKYYVMQVQTSPSDSKKVVCFSPTKANQIKQFQDKKSPIKIRRMADFQGTPAINDFTQVEPLKPFDIDYVFNELPGGATKNNDVLCVEKKISEIKKDSTHSGYVHVTGYIKIMSEELKNVWIHTRGSFGKLNENCMILDDTGCMKINISVSQSMTYFS